MLAPILDGRGHQVQNFIKQNFAPPLELKSSIFLSLLNMTLYTLLLVYNVLLNNEALCVKNVAPLG